MTLYSISPSRAERGAAVIILWMAKAIRRFGGGWHGRWRNQWGFLARVASPDARPQKVEKKPAVARHL